MKRLFAVTALLWMASAYGQIGLAPCTSKTPAGVPCFDKDFGVVVRFSPPIPTEKLSAPVQPSESEEVSQSEAEKLTGQAEAQKLTPSSASQYWSYQADGTCEYHDGSDVQRFDADALQNYVSNPAQFQASYQTEEAAGAAVGALVRAWVAHHHRVTLERENIRQQISAYYNGTFDLNDEVMSEQDALVTDFALLARLDPARRSIYDRGAENAATFKAHLATVRPSGAKLLSQLLATKKVKYLRSDLFLAQQTYEAAVNGAEQQYAFFRFVSGLAGYFESRQAAQPAAQR